MRRSGMGFFALALVALSAVSALAETPPLSAGARVAIVGDSITEQKLYSKYIEAYLLACSGLKDLEVFQFGWSGETAGGFANRVENDLGVFKPTVVTLCYGMNDGGYRPWQDSIGQGYETNMRSVLKKLDALGVKTIVVGSPGAVDQNFFRPGQKLGEEAAHVAYNDNLAHLRDIDRSLQRNSTSDSPTCTTPCTSRCRRPRRSWARSTTCAGGMVSTPARTAS